MKNNRVDVITMGCSKNLVDSEHLMRQLQECGYEVTHDSENPCGEIAVINTCGFIGDAKQESINMILEFCQRKEEGDLKKLYVMGCLSERYLDELREEITYEDILAIKDPFYRSMALQIFNGDWDKFRVCEAKAYPHPDRDAAIFFTPPHTLLDNVTGMYAAEAGEPQYIFV